MPITQFKPLVTRRLNVQMRELSIMDSIRIVGYDASSYEATITAMLRACSEDGGMDPLYWTLQERTLGVCHYLMCLNTEDPDFKVGAYARFTDYLFGADDVDMESTKAPILVGEVGGDAWAMNHLYGYMLESLERIKGLAKDPKTGEALEPYLHWFFGLMAAQMVPVQLDAEGAIVGVLNEGPDPSEQGAYDDWMLQQISIMVGYPDNAFAAMRMFYFSGQQLQHHLFDWRLSDDGSIVFMPCSPTKASEKDGAEVSLPPATFPPLNCTSPAARELGRKSL